MMYVRLWEGKPGTGLVRVPTVNHRAQRSKWYAQYCPVQCNHQQRFHIGLLPIESHHYSLAME